MLQWDSTQYQQDEMTEGVPDSDDPNPRGCWIAAPPLASYPGMPYTVLYDSDGRYAGWTDPADVEMEFNAVMKYIYTVVPIDSDDSDAGTKTVGSWGMGKLRLNQLGDISSLLYGSEEDPYNWSQWPFYDADDSEVPDNWPFTPATGDYLAYDADDGDWKVKQGEEIDFTIAYRMETVSFVYSGDEPDTAYLTYPVHTDMYPYRWFVAGNQNAVANKRWAWEVQICESYDKLKFGWSDPPSNGWHWLNDGDGTGVHNNDKFNTGISGTYRTSRKKEVLWGTEDSTNDSYAERWWNFDGGDRGMIPAGSVIVARPVDWNDATAGLTNPSMTLNIMYTTNGDSHP
jgi:hypothetical protein